MAKYIGVIIVLLTLLGFYNSSANDNYWQQKVDVLIRVLLDDEKHFLHGDAQLNYHNHSSDTLSFIYFHLFPNAYKNDRTAFARQQVENGVTEHYFSNEGDRGYMDSLNFEVNNFSAQIVYTKDPDIIKLILNEPLLPHKSIVITTTFRVKIPLTFSRLGHKDQNYQISQWYPKPAVYDKEGWHPLPYLSQGEFYSEFGDYEVQVTLPDNYIIMGTGNIVETTEHLWLDSMCNVPFQQDSLGKIYPISSSPNFKTVTFKESSIHDFAWFASKNWLVRKDTILLADNKLVDAYVCFYPNHLKGWTNAMGSLKKGIHEYSNRVGWYPYSTVKVVEGALSAGGGMEYPTLAVIDFTNDPDFVNTVIVHEIGHNWFYGILANNERKYPWMDEGINSYYERIIAPLNSADLKFLKIGDETAFVVACLSAIRGLQAVTLPSEEFRSLNYGVDVYQRGSMFFTWLAQWMGEDNFNQAMKAYYEQWKFKHPQPEDFEKIFRNHSPRDLDWFFKEVIHSEIPVDFSLQSVKREGESLGVTVKNKTKILAPALVNLVNGSGDTISVWTEPFTDKTTISFNKIDRYQLIYISEYIPDYNLKNNSTRAGIAFRPLLGLNYGFKTKNWIAPSMGYNFYDGFMAGLLFHNITLPQNKFQYLLAPLYGFGSNNFSGTGIMGYTKYFDQGIFHHVQINLEGKLFTYGKNNLNINNTVTTQFLKLSPEVIFYFNKPYARSTVQKSFSLKGYWINEERMAFHMDSNDSLYRPVNDGWDANYFVKAKYEHRNSRTFNPFNYSIELQAGEQFLKLSGEANFRIDYHLKNKALYFRIFGGKMFSFQDDINLIRRYSLATTHTGINDYLFDDMYVGRREQTGFVSQQLSKREGGFKMATLQYAQPLGWSNDWLTAINLKTDIPYIKLPIRIFLDVATFSDAKILNPSGSNILYQAGLEVELSKYLTFYIPVILSKDYQEYSKSVLGKDRFWKMITFSLNFQELKWMNASGMILRNFQ